MLDWESDNIKKERFRDDDKLIRVQLYFHTKTKKKEQFKTAVTALKVTSHGHGEHL